MTIELINMIGCEMLLTSNGAYLRVNSQMFDTKVTYHLRHGRYFWLEDGFWLDKTFIRLSYNYNYYTWLD